MADSVDAKTVAFPLVSGGSHGWPVEDAVMQQIVAVTSASTRVEVVTLVSFTDTVARLTAKLLN